MADGTQQNGGVRAQQIQSVHRHHAAVVEVVVRPPIEVRERKLDGGLAPGGHQYLLGGWYHFVAYAVPGDNRDCEVLHDRIPKGFDNTIDYE